MFSLSEEQKNLLTPQFLTYQYLSLEKSMYTIAKEFNFGRDTLSKYLKKYNIKIRSAKDFSKLRDISGKNNPMYKSGICLSKPKCKDCGKSLVNFYCSLCHSCAAKGKRNPRYGKLATHGRHIEYSGIYFRSSWEASFAEYLDKNNIKWFYESTTFHGEDYSYTPDFYLPETDEYIEIKGWWRDNALYKIQKFIVDFPYIILTVRCKHSLKKLGVI